MHYVCGECGVPIGLIADEKGRPIPFRCSRTRRVVSPQIPVKRETPRATLFSGKKCEVA